MSFQHAVPGVQLPLCWHMHQPWTIPVLRRTLHGWLFLPPRQVLMYSCVWSQRTTAAYLQDLGRFYGVEAFYICIFHSCKWQAFVMSQLRKYIWINCQYMCKIKKAGKQNSKQMKTSLSTSHLCYNKSLFQSRWNLIIQRLNPSLCKLA